MGVLTGQSEKEKFFSYACEFFRGMLRNYCYHINSFTTCLVTIRTKREPGWSEGDEKHTWASDTHRTLVKMGIVKRYHLSKGRYCLEVHPREKDAKKFNNLYPIVKDPNRKKNKMKKNDQVEGLKSLGAKKTEYKLNSPSMGILETFENKFPGRDYNIQFIFPEFTSLCPKTGQPDFATIEVNYVPDKLCIESKSLKLYFFSYRGQGDFMETIVNKVLEDLSYVCKPRCMEVKGKFNARGGTFINVTANLD